MMWQPGWKGSLSKSGYVLPCSLETVTTLFVNYFMFHHSVGSNSAIPWSVAHQAPLSMEFSRQEYWSGLPCPPPRDLPDPGIKPVSSASSGRCFITDAAAAAAKSLQSCLTLCSPIDSSPPSSSVPGILQAIILEWVAITFFNA